MQANNSWTARSYAKINLGLFVHARRPDGYHDIETGFVYVDWCDTFRVKRQPGPTRIRSNDPNMSMDESNTVVKAYRLFEQNYGIRHGYDILLEKTVPLAAGLGGGSSNAASMLRILNRVEDRGLGIDQLADLGSMIGADVPFFLLGEPAIGTGTGTTLRPAPIQPDAWIVTVYPNLECSTRQAYENCEPNPDHELRLENLLLDVDMDEWFYLLNNDLEPAVMAEAPMIGDIKDQMSDFGAVFASMSGSGSSVFGLFHQDFVALNAWHGFTDLGFRTNMTRPKFSPDHGIYLSD